MTNRMSRLFHTKQEGAPIYEASNGELVTRLTSQDLNRIIDKLDTAVTPFGDYALNDLLVEAAQAIWQLMDRLEKYEGMNF